MLEETAAGLKAEIVEILEKTDEAQKRIEELMVLDQQRIQRLVELEEDRFDVRQKLAYDIGTPAVRESLHTAYTGLRGAYEERTAAREALRNAKDAFAVAEANATVEVKMGGGLVEKDPATGKSNKAWIDGQVATMLEKHPDYQAAKKALASAQNRVYETDMSLDLAQSRLSVARNEARLVAAMLGVGGNNG